MRIAVVGAGAAGLFTAWYLQRLGQGNEIFVFDKGAPGQGTTRKAAGMLAPIHELEFQELELLQAGLASRKLYWEEVAPALGEIGLKKGGSIEVALSQDDGAYLRRQFEFQQQQGLDVNWLVGEQIQDLEPFVSPTITQAIYSQSDTQLDNWLLVERLVDDLRGNGVEVVENATLQHWERLSNGKVRLKINYIDIEFDKVLLALGVPDPEIAARLPYKIYPVRGEMVCLNIPEDAGPHMQVRILSKVLGNAYLVPKAGRLLCGSTAEEQGLEMVNTGGGLLNILRKCHAVVPSIFELPVQEIWAGLRPSTLNRLPILDKSSGMEVYHLNGLYRHGILLGPLLGKSAALMLLGQDRLAETAKFILPTPITRPQ